MPRSTLPSKGQITLSKEIRDGAVVVEAETIDLRTLRGIVKRRGKRVSLAAMEKAVRRGAVGR